MSLELPGKFPFTFSILLLYLNIAEHCFLFRVVIYSVLELGGFVSQFAKHFYRVANQFSKWFAVCESFYEGMDCIIIHLLLPWLLQDIQELDKVQKQCLKLCSTNIDLEPLSRRRDRVDLCETWKQLNGRSIDHALTLSNTTSTMGNSRKLQKKYAQLDPRKYYFSNRVPGKK